MPLVVSLSRPRPPRPSLPPDQLQSLSVCVYSVNAFSRLSQSSSSSTSLSASGPAAVSVCLCVYSVNAVSRLSQSSASSTSLSASGPAAGSSSSVKFDPTALPTEFPRPPSAPLSKVSTLRHTDAQTSSERERAEMTCAGCSAYILPTALCEVQVTVFKLFRGGFEIFSTRGENMLCTCGRLLHAEFTLIGVSMWV